jgi:hypothetical protein
MLEASITFSGAGQLCMYTGNCEAIQAPTISQTNAGQYMVQFLTGRHIDRTKIPCACITVTCQNTSGIAVIPIVFPSPTSTYNANATGGYFYTITFGVQTLSLTGAFVNPIEVTVNIVAKNAMSAEEKRLQKERARYKFMKSIAEDFGGREISPEKMAAHINRIENKPANQKKTTIGAGPSGGGRVEYLLNQGYQLRG